MCPLVSETDNSCKVCCRDSQGRCVPYVDSEQKNLFLRKGKPCTVGFCDMNVSTFMYSFFCPARWEMFSHCPQFCKWKETNRAALSSPSAHSCVSPSGEVSAGTAYAHSRAPSGNGALSRAGAPSPETGQDLGSFGKAGGCGVVGPDHLVFC